MTWAWHRLGNLLVPQPNGKVVQQGWSPGCHPQPADDGEWGFLKTTAIQDGRFEPEHNKLLPNHMTPRRQIEVHTGDLLMTCAGPRARCGVPALVRHTRPRLMMSGKMYRFRPDERVLPAFLELWLRSPEAQRRIDAMKTGISDSGLNLTHDRFVDLPVPVPPVGEQLRIVDLLEHHPSRLDAADAYIRAGTLRGSRWHGGLIDDLLWREDYPRVEVQSLLREPMRNGRSDPWPTNQTRSSSSPPPRARTHVAARSNPRSPSQAWRHRASRRFEHPSGDVCPAAKPSGSQASAMQLMKALRRAVGGHEKLPVDGHEVARWRS
jgi:type I restriction enzyme S subunit